MTILTLELPPELYDRLRVEADRQDKPIQLLARELLAERLALPAPAGMSERERVADVLRAAGLLAELSQEEKQRAAQCTTTLEEVRAALDRAGGPPLSKLILEMRGPKE